MVTVVVFIASYADLVIVCEGLTKDGYAALPATSGEAALRLCRFASKVDMMMIADLNLPAIDGLELLRDRRHVKDFPEIGSSRS